MFSPPLKKSIVFLKYALKMDLVKGAWFDLYEFIDHDLDIDYEKEMARIQSEMKDILKQEKKSQQMLEEAFREIGYGID